PQEAFADPGDAGAGDAGTEADVGAARVVADRGHALEIEATLAHDGLLVLNDTMLAGWTATVDGRPAALIEVNGLVRGVWLEAGTHRVTMRYVPPGLLTGGGITLAALVVVATLAWLGRRSALRAVAFAVPPPLVRAER
ncbi:YfhO family protein, partial [Candidatus Binatia bacterium]|nr:YfhO family protein [Candidatus Binatia bacterium]